MDLRDWQSVVSIVVGGAGIVALLIGVGKGWATLSAASAKLTALHGRLDKISLEQQSQRLNLVQIRTFLQMHPTLRFRVPEASQSKATQDMFKEEDIE